MIFAGHQSQTIQVYKNYDFVLLMVDWITYYPYLNTGMIGVLYIQN